MEKRLSLYLIVVLLVSVSYIGFLSFMMDVLDRDEVLRDYPFQPPDDMSRFHFPDNEGLNTSIMSSVRLAGDYLVNHLSPKGRWDYEYNATSGKSSGDYNLLRHAGTTYALSLIFKYGRDPDHYNGSVRSMNYLLSRYMRFRWVDDSEIAILSYGTCTKLGGPALVLMGILQLKDVDPGLGYDREMRGCLNFILKMQRDDGSFQCYFGSREDEQSDYYPGEAMLALSMYHRMRGGTAVLEALKDAASFYNGHFPDGYTAYSPWATEALVYLDTIENNESFRMKAHAMARSCMRGQIYGGEDPFVIGAFSSNPGASTASRIESVCDAYLLAKRTDDHRNSTIYAYSIDLCADFLMRFQLASGSVSGLPHPERALGGVPNARDDLTIRIDNVQHTAVVLIKVMVYQVGVEHI